MEEVLFCCFLCIDSTSAECNVCQQNEVACINSTSFYLCFSEIIPYMDVLYHCKEGFECTEYNSICLQASATRLASCGSTSLCGHCTAQRNALFACLSRTTFQMCYGSVHPTGQVGFCPNGFVCDATSDSICVSAVEAHAVTCDLVDSSSPKTGASTSASTITLTPTTESSTRTYPLIPDEVCAQQSEVGLYPTVPNDLFCKRYIHCRVINGGITGTEYSCATGTYYSIERQVCTLYKPAYCI